MAALVSTHEQDFEEVQTELGVTHAKQKRRERELKERHARELHDAKLEGQQASEDVLQLKAEMDALRQRHAVEIHNKNVQLDEAEVGANERLLTELAGWQRISHAASDRAASTGSPSVAGSPSRFDSPALAAASP